MYEFLGALIGMCVRSGILMSLNLPGFVWKQLTDEELTINDLNEIDELAVKQINELKEVRQNVSEEEFFTKGYDFNFTTILSNT
jgi:E3 ubiquitin-protein ligase HECTD3